MKKIENKIIKRAIIAGASAALKYRRLRPTSSEDEILKKVVSNIDFIADNVDTD